MGWLQNKVYQAEHECEIAKDLKNFWKRINFVQNQEYTFLWRLSFQTQSKDCIFCPVFRTLKMLGWSSAYLAFKFQINIKFKCRKELLVDALSNICSFNLLVNLKILHFKRFYQNFRTLENSLWWLHLKCVTVTYYLWAAIYYIGFCFYDNNKSITIVLL